MIRLLLLILSFAGCAQESATIPIEGGVMHYRLFGNGDPILVINGGPGMSSEGFTDLAQKLSQYGRVILYDQRGTGKSILSGFDGDSISMELMVEDIEVLRRHLGIDRWSVLGHSFGGMLASHYAARHRHRINKLIMSSSGGIDLGLLDYVREAIDSKLTGPQRDSLGYWNRQLASGNQTRQARNGRARALAPAYVFNKTNAWAIAKRLTQGNFEVNSLVWQDLRSIGFDHSNSFAGFDKKVLVIQGRDDIIKVSTAQQIASAFPKSELILLDKCGHYGWLDRPDAYFPAIQNFLKVN